MQQNIKNWALLVNEKDKNKNSKFYLNYLTKKFYELNEFLPVWTINFELNENASEVFKLIRNANYYGFYSETFNMLKRD